jgi:hypothetical protein
LAKEKNDLLAELERANQLCQFRLKNAEKLIDLTGSEAERWKITVESLNDKIE